MNIQLFNFTIDVLQSILWQYQSAQNLIALLNYKNDWLIENHTDFWESWVDDVFNLTTANDFGVAVWSIILDIPIYLNNSVDNAPVWGFSFLPFTNQNFNFENGSFSALGTVITLSLEEQRLLLRLRYYQLVSAGRIEEINNFLYELFISQDPPYYGGAWVLDGLDMSITYVFTFPLAHPFKQALIDLDVLPRPAGVEKKYIFRHDSIWGFGNIDDVYRPGISYVNFENGNFFKEF